MVNVYKCKSNKMVFRQYPSYDFAVKLQNFRAGNLIHIVSPHVIDTSAKLISAGVWKQTKGWQTYLKSTYNFVGLFNLRYCCSAHSFTHKVIDAKMNQSQRERKESIHEIFKVWNYLQQSD